ncbi:Hypothetical protein SCLAV_2031 [Streptomyces clavuligerus]|uniref:Uncharacterized protein n=1 Tax=Streptomyces clavuligerus TaxID=1901 RepID=E2Q563_STRCL|nr:Hypothetical protein SCLAV_2031 [Streptomyces clavuligerus]
MRRPVPGRTGPDRSGAGGRGRGARRADGLRGPRPRRDRVLCHAHEEPLRVFRTA